MSTLDSDRIFSRLIPGIYDSHLVPLIFEPYAMDLAHRVALRSPRRVLEIAAGTGAVTRHLASALPDSTLIVATDLNKPMLDFAAAIGTRRPVDWRRADAMKLPFPDGEFDAILCQFGVMFFADKVRAFAEARRVLAPNGVYLFNVWDRIEENEFADTVTRALATVFPRNPPQFLARTPHGYHDIAAIERHLASAGFSAPPRIVSLEARSRASSPRIPAIGFCQGTPLRDEIEARDSSKLDEATDAAAEAIERRFGPGRVDGKIQAHIVAIEN